MSAAYPFYNNQFYLLTRRVRDGEFRLRPTKRIRRIFLYLAFFCAERHGIELFAALLMSNHYHLVVRDRFGRLADFLRDFHARLYDALRELQGRDDILWEPGRRPGRTLLGDNHAVEQKILYTLLNPARADLEVHGRDWCGTLITPHDAGRTISVPRPDLVCMQGRPAVLSHTVGRPPGFDDMSHAKMCRHFDKKLEHAEDLLAKARTTPVLGSAAALRLPIETRPAKPLEHTPNPNFATRNPELRKQLNENLRNFRKAYRQALEASRDKDKRPTVIFPAGTYAMHFFHNFPRHPE